MFRAYRSRGQGLVEFALVIPVLLLAVLSIIEGALLFQSFLAIQHAAREAARFAVTYQPPIEYDLDQVQELLRGGRPPEAYPDEKEEDESRCRINPRSYAGREAPHHKVNVNEGVMQVCVRCPEQAVATHQEKGGLVPPSYG